MDSPPTYDPTALEQALSDQHNNKKLRSLFMQAPAAIALLEGPQHVYTFANPLYQKIFNRTEAQLIGKTPRQVFPEVEGQGIYELFDRVYNTNEAFTAAEFPATFKNDDGVTKTGYYNFVIQPIQNDAGEVSDLMVHVYEVTGQVKAHKKTEESEAKYRTLFNSMDQGFCVIEMIFDKAGNPVDYRFLEVNHVFELQTGLNNAFGRTVRELVPDLEERWFQAYGEVALTGKPLKFTEGSEAMGRWFEVNAFRFGDGESRKVAVLFTDITKRKEIERELVKSENYFRQLTDTVPAIIWITRPDGYCTYLNKNWYAYTGQTEGEAEGFGWLQATHPDDAEEAGRLFIEATEKQQPYYFLYRLRHKSGEYRWAIDSGQPKFGADGTFEGMIGTVIDVHEQKLAEDKIRESERRFRSMADASPVMIWTLDENGNSTYYNRRAREFTRYSEDDLKEGKSWQASIHPRDMDYAAGVVGHAVANRIPYEMECRMQNAQGEWRWILSHGTPRFGADGEYFGFVGSSIDITERKKAESDLAQSETRFRSIFQTAGVSIWEEDFSAVNEAINELKAEGVTDFRTYLANHPAFVEKCLGLVTVTDVNDATLQMFEAESKEQVVANLANIFLPDTMPVFVGELVALAEGQTTYASECRLKTLKGNSLYVLFSMRLPAQGNSFKQVLFTLLDITERKAAEEKIRQSETRFRFLAEAFPHLAWTASPEGKALYFNRRWYEYTGLSEEEALNDDGRKVLHPADWQKATDYWQQRLTSGDEEEVELRYREGATGQFRWFLVKAVPVKKEDGQVMMWIGTCTDIHEQKMAMESLEGVVVERTKELQRSNEDLQQFAHVASHDLKEPVRKVKTFVSRLEEQLKGRLNETEAKFIERIHSATDRMFTMIDGVLRYSTVNADTEASQPVNLAEIFKNIETDLEVIIQKTGTRLHYDRLPTIEGVPVLLYQVFYNLVNNSIKFAKAGVAPQITVAAETVVQNNRPFAKLVLSDNGIGFEEEHATAIFDTFTRLHSKDKYEGTGLGLALCKKVVERHGGSIWADGKPGAGATFTLLLPLHQTKKSVP